jgi:hypothetical protein
MTGMQRQRFLPAASSGVRWLSLAVAMTVGPIVVGV